MKTLEKFSFKIMTKIGILSTIQIIFIIILFAILFYFQSQQTLLGNTINIAGKNRFLSTYMLYEISEYLANTTTSSTSYVNTNILQIKSAENQIESNIMALKNGGKISDIELKPIPSGSINSWNILYEKWNSLKNVLENRIYKKVEEQRQNVSIINPVKVTNIKIANSIKQDIIPLVFGLYNLSDILVKQLGETANKNVDNIIILQIVFGVLIGLLILFVLILVGRLLKPISLLTKATSEVKNGNLETIVNYYSNDELSFLAESFNSMIATIKNDITKQTELTNELSRLNTQLKDNDKSKTEFIAMISHELRSPLVPIKAYAEMLLRAKSIGELNEKQRKAIQSISRNVIKEESLVDDILDVYKLDLGKINLIKKEVRISDLFTDVINDLKLMAEEKQISIVTEINTKSEDKVYCDKKRIEQVLSNLIKNSIDFVPEKEGKIILIAEDEDGVQTDEGNRITNTDNKNNNSDDKNKMRSFNIFTVKDNGIGIPEDKLDNLFKKFYQIDSSDTRKHGGTGLGLIICKGIVEAHGGRIWFDRNSKNETTIKFSLPKTNFDP